MGTGTETYYARRAQEYDAVYAKPERQGDIAALAGWLAALTAGRSVREVAAGTGWWTNRYADGAADVVATDVNEEVLSVARARRAWPSTVRFAVADAFAPDPTDGPVDVVMAGFLWSHVRRVDLGRLVAALAGSLTPGGRVVVFDNVYVEGSNHPIARRDADGDTYQRRRLDDGSSWEVRKNFPTDEELRRHLEPWGAVEVRRLTYFWLATLSLRP